jgi:toxin YhaV
MVVNSWRLYSHPLFEDQLEKLTEQVERLKRQFPDDYGSQAATKLLATISRLIYETIPADPNSTEFRQGNTLGVENRHWFRAKFHARYRLFFRFSSQEKVIVYAWVNDETSLLKAGSKTDPYAVFASMLKAGDPPTNFSKLLKASRDLKRPSKG